MNIELAKKAYEEAILFIRPYITYELCKKISLLDKSIDPDRGFDFINYLNRSFIRYERIFNCDIVKGKNWLEVGALFPVLPITLSILGFNVSVVENYSFYPPELIKLYTVIKEKYNIRFKDVDFSKSAKYHFSEKFDYVSLMAVLEHLPYTSKILLGNIYLNMNHDGLLFVDVPNIYYFHKILQFLKGHHIQQPMEVLFNSGIPYVGHHREYNFKDLMYILSESGFKIKKTEYLNYSSKSLTAGTRNPFDFARYMIGCIKKLREIIFIVGEKS